MSTQLAPHKRAASGFLRLYRATFTTLLLLLGLTARGLAAAPVINSLSPTAGAVGVQVTISGNNFGNSQASSTVTFNGTIAAARGRLAVSWSNTSIVVNVPSGATTGPVVVTVGGSASNGVNFTVKPAITSLSPTSGPVSTSITVTGTNFGATQGTSTITFNGTVTTPTSWSNTSIVAPVPSGATTGNVVVTVSSTASNGVSFTVTPSISSLSPASGAAGTSVTISGTNFGATQGTSIVSFNGTAATPTSWSNTSIVVPVPNGAATGNVVVTVAGNASNGASFTVTLGIGSESPVFGPVGTTVTINGTGFGTSGTVTFNGTATTPTTWTNASIVAPVPTGATSGNVVVTAAGTNSNPKNFTVTPSPTNPAATFNFNVNTTADTVDATPGDSLCADSQGNCSLRAAVMEANASLASGITLSVTISVPAGTYQLVIPDNGLFNSTGGHLDITAGPVSIVGASASNTIIEAGTQVNANGIPNGIDKVFAINPFGAFAGFSASLSNLTLQFGLNQSTSDPFGGGIEWDAGTDGAGSINITNCVIANNATVITDNTATTTADGGGLSLTNEVPSPVNEGSIAIVSTVIQGNIAQDSGGGIFEGSFPMQISGSSILSNQAVDNPSVQGIGQTGGAQTGGGMSVSGPTVGSQTVIQGNVINGNIAGAQGGGIFTTAGVQVTSDTLSANHAGSTGGGLFSNTLNGETTGVSGTNITQNVAGGDGGGVEVDNNPTGNNLTMSFSRIVGNTAVAGNGLNNISGTVTATDNWWGCNQGPGGSPCDVVNNTATATFNPWLTLSNSANPASITATANSTLTASFLQDSANTTFAPGSQNMNAFSGLPISFQNAIDGSLSNCQTAIQSNGTATCIFTGASAGAGSADATVDSATATAHINIADFSVSLTPASQNVVRGGSVNYTLTVAPLNGFTGTVNLSCSVSGGTGITLSGCPSSVTITSGSVNATITATTSLSASLTNDQVNVQGTNASVPADTHSASSGLNVTDFSVSITPSTQSVTVGTSGSFTATISPQNGFTGQVNIACSISPAGPSITGCPASVNITTSAVSFNLTIGTSGVTPQTYTLTVQGTSNVVPTDVHSGSATLTLQDFSLSLTPASQQLVRGSSVNYTLTVSPLSGFTGTVNLSSSVSGGTGITLSGCPVSVTITSGSVSCTLNAAASLSASLTNDQINVQGTNASVPADTHSTSSTAAVTDISLSLTPASQTVSSGSTATFTLTVSPLNGFTGQVNVSCSISPTGPTINGCPASVTITSGAVSSNITIATAGLSLQTYTLTVHASPAVSPADVQSASATMTLQALILRPTSFTSTSGSIYSNPANAGDGNPSTFAAGPGAINANSQLNLAGFAAVSGTPTQILLKVTSAANCTSTNDGVEIQYSKDGTHNNDTLIYQLGLYAGLTPVPRALQTDVITLPANQITSNVQVLGLSFSQATTGCTQIYDAWMEVTY